MKLGERLSLTAGPDARMSNCMAVVTGLSLEYAPSVMGGEYEAANTGTLGTKGNANGLFTVYNFQVADYHDARPTSWCISAIAPKAPTSATLS